MFIVIVCFLSEEKILSVTDRHVLILTLTSMVSNGFNTKMQKELNSLNLLIFLYYSILSI